MDAGAGPQAPTAPELERRVRAYWDRTGVVARVLADRPDGPTFRFTEGPPTANGAPHVGHVVSRALKDVQLRYRRMTGHRIVASMAGWDCHGLPVELEIEKRHGLRSKQEIEAFGVARFCDDCRASVFETVALWREMSGRMAYWLDYDRAYATMDPRYVESVWWSLKTLFDRGLLEKGHYSLPYCPRCETPLSSHEVAQGYRETTDPSVTIRLRVRDPPGNPPRYLLVWTTTPWTLPANLLVAARADLAYVSVRAPDGAEHLLAAAAVDRHQPGAPVVRRFAGAELAGLAYDPPFPFAGDGPGRYRVVLDDFVAADEGTGFVHIAPSYGPDDMRVGAREGVGLFDPLDSRGRFTDRVPLVAGQAFKAADAPLLAALDAAGHLVHRDRVRHTYPFCWRCGSALLYRAVDSWFVRTSRFAPELVRLNASVRWIPAHLRDGRFGNFLTEAKDWALSRNRYWGTPLPIWVCPAGHATCVGSFAELAERSGAPLPDGFDAHRVSVDPIAVACATCGAAARREPYTIDGWYDSGSAPFAQFHYPFEPGPFDPAAPLDYIAEGLDQTRGWFYTLLVLAAALFGRPAYRVCVANGLVLDADGQKMSKSKGNALDPVALLGRLGGDAVRWSFLVNDFTDAIRVAEPPIRQAASRTLGTAVHVARFFTESARADGLPPDAPAPAAPGPLDAWLLSRLEGTRAAVTESLASYDPRPGALALRGFVDDLSTWYLRRSRPRFWSERRDDDRRRAHATLATALGVLARLLAPYAPFTAEAIHQERLGGRWDDADASVHLAGWPAPLGGRNPALEAAMEDLRGHVEVVRELRQRAGVKARRPLPAVVRVARAPDPFDALGAEGVRLLTDELNVAELRREAPGASAFDDADWVGRVDADGVGWYLARRPTPELEREGWVREGLRRLQSLRKELGLAFTERIELDLAASGALDAALRAAEPRLARELLADRIGWAAPAAEDPAWSRWEIDGERLAARLTRRG